MTELFKQYNSAPLTQRRPRVFKNGDRFQNRWKGFRKDSGAAIMAQKRMNTPEEANARLGKANWEPSVAEQGKGFFTRPGVFMSLWAPADLTLETRLADAERRRAAEDNAPARASNERRRVRNLGRSLVNNNSVTGRKPAFFRGSLKGASSANPEAWIAEKDAIIARQFSSRQRLPNNSQATNE